MKKTDSQYKTRAHRVLFEHDTPFRPRRVELKTRYRRRAKHVKRDQE
jgi:hypothetical protein